MNKIFFLLLLFILSISFAFSDERIQKLKNLLEEGFITDEEFKQALNQDSKKKNKIKVKQISGKTGREKFEKYEFYIDNFRVHTLSPGTIRIDNMLTGETDVTLHGNFKTKFSRNGKNFFEFQHDKENLKSNLLYRGKVIINWTGRYVRRYRATFHQMQVDGIQPFHYFITLPKKNPVSINFKVFEKKIEKAVTKVKKELSAKYNLSVDDIDKIMETRESTMSK